MKYVLVESTELTRRIIKMNLEKELRALQTELSADPRKGRLDPGACGLRKIRMRLTQSHRENSEKFPPWLAVPSVASV